MPVAFIEISPLVILAKYASPPAMLTVPGLGDVHGAEVGWTSENYMLADLVIFVPPDGQMITGEPSYELAGDTVTETYETVPLPTETVAGGIYADAIIAGISLTWVPSSQLDGTYALDQASMHKLNSIWTALVANNSFPNKQSTQRWKKADGTAVLLSAAQFKNFCTALSDYVASLDEAHFGHIEGDNPTWPSNQVTIAG